MSRLENILKRELVDEHTLDPSRPLWRTSGGSLKKAREIAKNLVLRYNGGAELVANEAEFNLAFDIVCAKYFNGGVEIEWAFE